MKRSCVAHAASSSPRAPLVLLCGVVGPSVTFFPRFRPRLKLQSAPNALPLRFVACRLHHVVHHPAHPVFEPAEPEPRFQPARKLGPRRKRSAAAAGRHRRLAAHARASYVPDARGAPLRGRLCAPCRPAPARSQVLVQRLTPPARAEPAAGLARQASSTAQAASSDTSYVLNPALRGDAQAAPAASSFLLNAVRRVHAAATRGARRQL